MLIIADVQGDVVIIDGIMHHPIPARVSVAKISLAHKLSVGNIYKVIWDSNTNLHALNLIAPLVFVGPPDARSYAFARGVNPWMARCICSKGEASKSALVDWRPGVVKVDRVCTAGVQCLREVNKDCAGIPLVFELSCAKKN